jgi:hypothetical protein
VHAVVVDVPISEMENGEGKGHSVVVFETEERG